MSDAAWIAEVRIKTTILAPTKEDAALQLLDELPTSISFANRPYWLDSIAMTQTNHVGLHHIVAINRAVDRDQRKKG